VGLAGARRVFQLSGLMAAVRWAACTEGLRKLRPGDERCSRSVSVLRVTGSWPSDANAGYWC
jgi:hypothetical protein